MNAMNASLLDRSGTAGRSPARAGRRSYLTEIVAAIYLALVLSAPWLVRDVSLITPPSHGVEIQMASKAAPQPAVAAPRAAAPQVD